MRAQSDENGLRWMRESSRDIRIETKGTSSCHGSLHPRPRQTKHESPEQTRRNAPAHANLTMRKREYFGRVRERHGALTRAVEGGKEVDERSDGRQMSGIIFGNKEAETGGQ